MLVDFQLLSPPYVVRATGLALWRYLGGPWAAEAEHPFGQDPPASG